MFTSIECSAYQTTKIDEGIGRIHEYRLLLLDVLIDLSIAVVVGWPKDAKVLEACHESHHLSAGYVLYSLVQVAIGFCMISIGFYRFQPGFM